MFTGIIITGRISVLLSIATLALHPRLKCSGGGAGLVLVRVTLRLERRLRLLQRLNLRARNLSLGGGLLQLIAQRVALGDRRCKRLFKKVARIAHSAHFPAQESELVAPRLQVHRHARSFRLGSPQRRSCLQNLSGVRF